MPQDHFGEDVAAKYDEESRAMFAPDVLGPTIDQLKRKDGAQRVNVSIGDMAATRIEGGFRQREHLTRLGLAEGDRA